MILLFIGLFIWCDYFRLYNEERNKAKTVTTLAHAKISTNFAKHTLIGCGWKGQQGEGGASVSLNC